jgi:hypothetical protein
MQQGHCEAVRCDSDDGGVDGGQGERVMREADDG